MAMFIEIEVDPGIAGDPAIVGALVEACPVDIFATNGSGTLTVVEENLDECTLCDLCMHAVPKGKVKIVRLYEDA